MFKEDEFQSEPRFRLSVIIAVAGVALTGSVFQSEPRFRLSVISCEGISPDLLSFNRSLGSAFL